jgi:hypothetical protein
MFAFAFSISVSRLLGSDRSLFERAPQIVESRSSPSKRTIFAISSENVLFAWQLAKNFKFGRQSRRLDGHYSSSGLATLKLINIPNFPSIEEKPEQTGFFSFREHF